MKTNMKQQGRSVTRIVALFLCYFVTLTINAQTYLEHLQQNVQGLGTVTVTQSKEIDDLVNASNVPVPKISEAADKDAEEKKEEPKERNILKPDMPTAKNNAEGDGVAEVDMSKKVMRNSHNITGYRVQAFAGRGDRETRKKADAVKTAIKRAYPQEPVYVHFYSPRWVCQVGNYRSAEEANRMLANIKRLGFTQAVVVKQKITVQY